MSILPEGCDVSVPNERKVARVTATQWRFLGGGLGSLFHTVCLHGKKYEASIDVFMDGLRLSLEEPYLDTCRLKVRGENSDDDVIFEFGDCDPYIKEISTFLDAVRTGNKSGIRSPYQDASKTYEFTRKIVAAEKR